MNRHILLAFLVIAGLHAEVLETGTFRLHKFLQPIGQETYQISRDGGTLTTTVDFKFTDRGSAVPLKATLQTNPAFQPTKFEIKGQTSRSSRIDDTVEVTDATATIREEKSTRTAHVPDHYFTIAGYAPATVQMLMMRYWSGAGKPGTLSTLPSGEVSIQPRGEDTITIEGKPVKATRYTIAGLIWGREMLWMGEDAKLIALISIDAEFDHFEAIREGYESALGMFVSKAAADNMAALADFANRISPEENGAVAITGGTLIDGTGSAPVENAAVVIQNGKIVAAGLASAIKIPKKARRIDAAGKTILPGLWDMHSHFEQVEWGPVYLAAGVTTARDNGNEFEFITAARDAIQQGHGLGPRLLLAGIVDGDSKIALGVIRANTPEEATAVVNKYHDAGFQQIKIYQSVKPDVVKALAAEAHRLGMTATGHVPTGMTVYDAVNDGMDMISHMYPSVYLGAFPPGVKHMPGMMPALKLDSPEAEHLIEFLKEHHTVLDPTMCIYELSWHSTADTNFEPGLAKVAPELAAPLKNTGVPPGLVKMVYPGFEGGLKLIGALHKAGVPIVAGTDQTVPGFSVYREMELYVQGGMSPMEAIQAATIVPARAMHLDNEVGTIQAGKRADIILVDGNPLESISNIRHVKTVVSNGRVYDTAPLWRSVGFQP